jgi:hypothetical protein
MGSDTGKQEDALEGQQPLSTHEPGEGMVKVHMGEQEAEVEDEDRHKISCGGHLLPK